MILKASTNLARPLLPASAVRMPGRIVRFVNFQYPVFASGEPSHYYQARTTTSSEDRGDARIMARWSVRVFE